MNKKINKSPEIIEIVNQHSPSSIKWKPTIGAETESLLSSLDIAKESKSTLRDENVRILSRCVPSDGTSKIETGLVVGYVQSGKTMSFTTVAALARDNSFPMIIVIAGTSIPLFGQSVSRLRKDLRLDVRSDRKWQLFKNPSLRDRNISAIKDTLMDWQDKSIPQDERQTVLIMVMKNHMHLKNLISVLSGFNNINWAGVPALIIDDEADQASLNTRIQDEEESTTFKRIINIRQILPTHTFLQYTATPQGPLLINIINVLSPFFAEVLSPGENYVGGKDFFINNSNLVEKIPPGEIPTDEGDLQEPPKSLKKAMAIFFIGVTAGRILQDGGRNRSMMVHPSIRRIRHNLFYEWVTKIKDNWQTILSLSSADPDRGELVKEFKEAYDNLAKTVKSLPKFKRILELLPSTIRKTLVEEINSARGRTPTIDWSANYSNILVGGQAMDRGYTVEGLTVTYMPRGVGVGNADTVQQRARFFGYKRDYLGYCRIFIDNGTMQAYKDYIEHEEDIRDQLIEHSKTGKPLSEWKRAFLMPRQLRPTRKNILDIDYIQDNLSDTWLYPRSPHDSADAVKENQKLIDNYVSTVKLLPDVGHKDRSSIMRHLINNNLLLREVYEKLLMQFRANNPSDSHKYTGLLLQIRNYLEQNPKETCSLYIMSCSSWKDGWQIRDRGLNAKDEIAYLFQGAHPDAKRAKVRQGEIYEGDSNIGDKSRLMVQLHRLNITKDDGKEIVAKDVYNVAVWIPEKMATPWLVQKQGSNTQNDN